MKKTMTTNAEWMQKKGYKFKDLRIYINFSDDKKWDYGIKIAKTKVNVHVKGDGPLNALTRWLDAEHVELILDDAEKRYLSAMIRPFRDEVQSIKKFSGLYASHCFDQIVVYYESFGRDLWVFLPPFEKGTMYKGMEPNKKYTLEELGL